MNNIKNTVKKVLGYNKKTKVVEQHPQNYPSSLKDLMINKPYIQENHISLSQRPDNLPNFPAVKTIKDNWDLLNHELSKYDNPNIEDIFEYDSLHSGTPMKYKPYPGSIREIKHINRDKTLYWYPATVGTNKAKQDFIEYLYKEGFPQEPIDNYDGIGIQNVAFTCSTTQAFNMILRVIARPYDVILIPAPNYGIFTLIPEKYNLIVETIDLKEEDNFFINANDLSNKIDEINNKLKKQYKNKLDYIPKVVAYLNLNPHNPIGNVMSNKNKEILESLGNVCLEKGVFIIDDLIYRDLCFDQQNKALPIASIPKYFNNTISLFGISKAYNLAGFRAAAILCPTPIFWGIAKEIFEEMDSTPVLQVKAMQGAFNGSNRREIESKKYLNKLINEYIYRLNFTTALINGINSVDEKYHYRIKNDIYAFEKDEKWQQKLLTPIPYLKIRNNTYPTSGFFLILDFTELKGKYYHNTKIKTEFDLLKTFYSYGKVKYLMGQNFSWPYKDEFVARTHFALEIPALIKNYKIIREVIEEMTDGKN